MSDPIENAITAEHSRQEHALAAALEQIDVAFGKEENRTAEQRKKRAERRLGELLEVREGLAKLADADAAKDRDDQGWTPVDPVTAFVIAWYLRKEADSDYYLSADNVASDALEEAADHIESGDLLACPQEMLAQLDEVIVELRAEIAGG
jgi:hypothetical protein